MRATPARPWRIYAPHGFSDVFNLVARPNPVLAPRSVYETKTTRWRRQRPTLTVLPWPETGDGKSPSPTLHTLPDADETALTALSKIRGGCTDDTAMEAAQQEIETLKAALVDLTIRLHQSRLVQESHPARPAAGSEADDRAQISSRGDP